MQDYFNFFGILRAFEIDTSRLRKQFIVNNKKYHPDFHTLQNQNDQDEVLRLATLNNEAYKVLTDKRQRILHLLRLENVMAEEGQSKVPQDFLIEMMDVNERIMDARMADDSAQLELLKDQLQQLESELDTKANAAMAKWDQMHNKMELEIIRDIYLKQQYLRRLQDQLQGSVPEL